MTSIKSLSEFFEKYPAMKKVVSHDREATMIAGTLSFIAMHPKHGDMGLSYDLLFKFSRKNSPAYPIVYETRGVIPRKSENHIGPDGRICLGSPLQLQDFVKEKPSLCCFVERIVIPYLYAITHKLLHYNGSEMIFGELSHGAVGLYEDLKQIFSTDSSEELLKILNVLNSKEKLFEESLCPLCKTRIIRKCKHRLLIQEWRYMFQNNKYYKKFYKHFSVHKEKNLDQIIDADESECNFNIRQVLTGIAISL